MTNDYSAIIKREAASLGFDRVGICPAEAPPGGERFKEWLAAGYAGEMRYLNDRIEAYGHPRHVLEGARSIVMLALGYRNAEPAAPAAGQGRVSRYAWGSDYHDVIREKLHRLADFVREQIPGAQARGVIDTAPLAEREFAQWAGLGWTGKNTLLLNPEWGSWMFLAALLVDVELDCDAPFEADHCGTCRACLDACPTGAFVDAYVLDARKCISYLTIELRGPTPVALRAGQGEWLFGCDVCQDVCPWNSKSPVSDEPRLLPAEGMNPVDLAPLFDLDDAAFRERFRHTPLWRPKRRGLLRNAAIVLGNQRHLAALPALIRGLADDEPLVRGACAWALGQLPSAAGHSALSDRLPLEADKDVRAEIQEAISKAVE